MASNEKYTILYGRLSQEDTQKTNKTDDSNSIQNQKLLLEKYARFDQAVLDRAGKTDFPDTREPREAHQVDPTTRYVTEIDPCVVNAVFVRLMELEDEQEETNHMNEIEQDELDEDMTAEL